ncbi:MAG TPA: segregation/condensation protein A [Polyangiaceae bacterium]|nr:segregation/condensation protein A [Polyangiaceae bacterium]
MSDESHRPGSSEAPAAASLQSERSDFGYRVKLPAFEGPLDLLLHLIQQHELDIMDIPIAFVTEKYVEYIGLMQEVNIDVASEYLVMAATLAHIKSKMLLPSVPADQEEGEGEAELDPRSELVRRLLEYQKYKQAADQLGSRSIFGRDVFARGAAGPTVEGPAPLAEVGLFKLLDAFRGVLDRAKTTIEHEIDVERFSITDRINELADVLRQRQRVRFEELFEGQHTRMDLIITFLALLEMTRLRMTRLFQPAPLDPIEVELAVTEEEVEGLAQAAAAEVSVFGPGGTPEATAEPPATVDVPMQPTADAAESPDASEASSTSEARSADETLEASVVVGPDSVESPDTAALQPAKPLDGAEVSRLEAPEGSAGTPAAADGPAGEDEKFD